MMAPPVRLLLLEDNRADAELVQAALAEFAPSDFAITHVDRLADALARIRTGHFDVLLSDLGLPDSTGLATVQAIAARAPTLPLVVLTGMKDDDLGRAAIRQGAQDYLVKGESSGALMVRTLRYAVERKRLEIGLRATNEALAGRVAERSAELDAANAILLANAAGYRQLFDANPQPMYMYDPETLRFIAVNDAAVAHYGWSREEFMVMTMADIRPAGELQRLRDQIRQVSRQRVDQGSFWKHRKKDGTLIDVEISSHVIEFGGRRARVVLVNDITERRRAEEALRESEARFRSLTEMSSDFYWESDVEQRFTVHNASGKSSQVSVFQRGAQIGQRRWDIPHLSPDEAGWQAHRAVLDAHRSFRNFVFSRRGVDGAERQFTVSGDPVFDASGAFKGYRGVGSDITERKRAEQALRDSERLLRESQSIAGLGSYVLDIPAGRWSSSAVLDGIFGIDGNFERSVAGWLSLIHPEWQERMSHYFADEVLGKHVRFDREYRIIRKTDGAARWVYGLGELEFDAQGQPRRMIGTISDITERKRTEQALTRQKDLYDALSQTNETIVRGTSREELFQSVCRIAVEQGHFLFAWIGLINQDDPWLTPVARYGDDAGYMAVLHATMSDRSIPKRGLSWLAIDSGAHTVANDFLTDPGTGPWHEAARRRGVRAFAAFPIRQTGEVVGVINVYAGASGFFTVDLLATLDEMAIDVSFALDNLEREAQRTQAEEALRESEARFRSLTEMSSDWYWEQDRELRLSFHSSGFAQRSGTTSDKLLGKCRWEEPNRFPLSGTWDEHRATLEAQKPFRDFEYVRIGDNGERYFVSLSGVPIYDAAGKFNGYRGIGTNITERKRAEQALRAAEEQFRGLVEQSIAGTYIIQDGKFAYVNPRFAGIFGYGSADEMIGRDALAVVAEKDRDRVAENMRRRIEGEVASINYDFVGVRKDGSMIEVGVHGAYATHLGRPAVIGLIQDISEKKRAEEQVQRYLTQLETAFMSTVGVATTLSEMRDPYTAGHERGVAEIAVAIGTELGFDDRRIEGLRVAGYLHDIGKITIPSEILSKPGKLSPIEYKLIQGHPQASYDVLKPVEFPWPVAEIALQHHERIDGSGYPQGLKGEATLLEARIMAVADVVEAMSSHRPYRAGLGIEKALAEIERGRGTAYDAVVADACLRLFREKAYRIPA